MLSTGDGIARIYGLERAAVGELLEFPHDVFGMVLNLEEDNVGAALFGESQAIGEGDEVRRTGRIAEVQVGPSSAVELSTPSASRSTARARSVRRVPPHRDQGAGDRRAATRQGALQTGIKAIDSLIPIGRGQRELIIGDRQTGMTAIALDTIINQRGGDVNCIYVAIGQKRRPSPRSSRSWRASAPWSTRRSSPRPPPNRHRPVHRALYRPYHGRVLPRQRTARAAHLRRPLEAGGRVPAACSCCAVHPVARRSPATSSPPLTVARARREDVQRTRWRFSDRDPSRRRRGRRRTFRRTSSRSPTARSSSRPTCSIPVFGRP